MRADTHSSVFSCDAKHTAAECFKCLLDRPSGRTNLSLFHYTSVFVSLDFFLRCFGKSLWFCSHMWLYFKKSFPIVSEKSLIRSTSGFDTAISSFYQWSFSKHCFSISHVCGWCSNLSLSDHVDEMCRKINFALRKFYTCSTPLLHLL